MTVNTELLRRKIEESGMSVTSFSAAIEMDPSTFYRKIDSGGCKFTIGQMHKTVAVLKLKKAEAVQIFLGENSQKCDN